MKERKKERKEGEMNGENKKKGQEGNLHNLHRYGRAVTKLFSLTHDVMFTINLSTLLWFGEGFGNIIITLYLFLFSLTSTIFGGKLEHLNSGS